MFIYKHNDAKGQALKQRLIHYIRDGQLQFPKGHIDSVLANKMSQNVATCWILSTSQ